MVIVTLQGRGIISIYSGSHNLFKFNMARKVQSFWDSQLYLLMYNIKIEACLRNIPLLHIIATHGKSIKGFTRVDPLKTKMSYGLLLISISVWEKKDNLMQIDSVWRSFSFHSPFEI